MSSAMSWWLPTNRVGPSRGSPARPRTTRAGVSPFAPSPPPNVDRNTGDVSRRMVRVARSVQSSNSPGVGRCTGAAGPPPAAARAGAGVLVLLTAS